jgi:E3 ubiquitin-protein ligase MARCH6
MAVNDATRDRVLSTLLGYVVIFSIFGIWLSNQKDTSVQLKSVIKTLMVLVKVVAFVATEIIAFPSMCGLILSFVTIPIFDTSITGRLAYYSRSGFSGFFLTWLSGTLWMFMFSVVIDVSCSLPTAFKRNTDVDYFPQAFRKIVRPGVLFWVRDPDSVDFHPVREIIERKATVQARKIAISGLLYGAIIVSTCGAGVLVLRLAVGKIRWTYQFVLVSSFFSADAHFDPAFRPLSTIPIDLLVFRFVIPFVLHHLEPRSRMRVLFEQWVHFAAGKLRFTSFIFGKRAPAEERSRRRFWSKWWSKEVAMVDTVVENGVEYAKDGGFARVPAFDGVRVPQKKKRKMVIRVQEDGTPFDGDVEAFTTIVEQIIEMVTARNDDKC